MITDDPKSIDLKLEDETLKREPSTPEEQLLEAAFMGNYDKYSTLIIQKRVDVNCVGLEKVAITHKLLTIMFHALKEKGNYYRKDELEHELKKFKSYPDNFSES